MEYFRYMIDMLRERGAEHIRVFGGGGGTITPEEIKELIAYGWDPNALLVTVEPVDRLWDLTVEKGLEVFIPVIGHTNLGNEESMVRWVNKGDNKFGYDFSTMERYLDVATKIAIGSMLSTTRANVSVGPPFDLAIYRNDSLSFDEHRIEADSAHLKDIQERFIHHLFGALAELPPIPWAHD